MRKLIWAGIILGLTPLFLGSACGGYGGYPGKTTSGVDAKLTTEVSVESAIERERGLWTFYVNYNNLDGPGMKTVSTFRDGTAPFGVFTSDGNNQQHFNDHVGVLVATAYDTNGDGRVSFVIPDYTLNNAFCPDFAGFTGDPDASDGFSAYCNKGLWSVLVEADVDVETKQSTPGNKFSNSAGDGTNYSPITVGQILASSTLNANGTLNTSISGLSLPNGASTTLTTPITATVGGYGRAIAINANQAGLVEAANWLASQWAGQPDGMVSLNLSFNGGAASAPIRIAGGNSASIVLRGYAATH